MQPTAQAVGEQVTGERSPRTGRKKSPGSDSMITRQEPALAKPRRTERTPPKYLPRTNRSGLHVAVSPLAPSTRRRRKSRSRRVRPLAEEDPAPHSSLS